MSDVSSPVVSTSASEERWRLWLERGRQYDVRFMRRAKLLLAAGLLLIVIVALLFLR